MKKPYPIRIEQEKYNQLKKLNVDPSKLFREFVDKIIGEKLCPLCGSKLKESQPMKIKSILLILFTMSAFSLGSKAEQQISLFGLSIHGTAVGPWAAKQMKNKITSDGTIALTPQINYSKIEAGNIFNISALSDCYGNAAVFIGKGKKYDFDKELSFGYLFGIYARQFPEAEIFGLFRVGLYQFIPTPVIYAQHRIGEKTFIRVQSNYLITFIDLAWEL